MRAHPWRVASLVIVGVICMTIIAYAQAPTTSLVGYWALDENSGAVAADSSGLNHTGNLVAGPAWVAGKSGSALAFGGSSYVAIGDIPEIRGQSEVTMAAWIKRSATNAMVLVGKQTGGHDLVIEAWNDGRLYFGVSNGSYADGYLVLNDTAWHHVALVFNGRLTGNANRLKGYVDGVQRALTFEGTIPATTTGSTTPFTIGKIQNDFSSGSVDELRLYARALSLDEVRSLGETASTSPKVTSVAPSSGPTAGGTAVAISGSGFATGASVSFGGTSATGVSVTGPTSISATTPTHAAGAVNVVVTNADGQSGSCAGCFSYMVSPAPAPTVTAITPSSGPTAGGTAVAISGTGFATGASVSFGGTPASAVTVTDATLISATAPAHAAGAVNVSVINADGLSGTCASCFAYSVSTSTAFPLTVSANGRYLQDANGNPFRIHGDSAWSMISNLTYAEADAYLNDRRAKGFNTVLVNLLERRFAVNAPANRNGDAPFTVADDFSRPNEAYFQFADAVIDLAASKDMAVMLAYMYVGSNPSEGWSAALGSPTNSRDGCYDFGLYLGNRYRDRSNIIWVTGGDSLPSSGSEMEIRLHRMMDGITAASGASRLHTGHWSPDHVSTDESAFAGAMRLNAVYSYSSTYTEARQGYAFAPAIPTFLIETGYEAEAWSPGDAASLRGYEYEAYLFGIGGVIYGHRDIWEFATDTWWSGFAFGHQAWQLSLDAPGALDMRRMDQLLDSLPWWNLVPANAGGMRTLVVAGGGTYGNGNYVTSAATPDGSALLAYVPPTGIGPRIITIDMTAMSGPTNARWFNPTTGGYIQIATALANVGTRAFTTPGNNGSGTNDWVLILERS